MGTEERVNFHLRLETINHLQAPICVNLFGPHEFSGTGTRKYTQNKQSSKIFK